MNTQDRKGTGDRYYVMKYLSVVMFVLTQLYFLNEASAHPGSGIVADRQGNIYIVDTRSGVWKLDREGHFTRLSGPAYHWMAIDVDNRLANVKLPYFATDDATVTRAGSTPTLILSSDFPVAVGPDGSLYYPWLQSGRVQIYRLLPSGETKVFKVLPPARSSTGEIRWRNGIVVTADGSVYYTEDRAVRRISASGDISDVISDLTLPGCGKVAGVEPELGPYCRGLDVDSHGNVYVAAAGCQAVLKITPDKKVTTVMRSPAPWSPTGVVVSGSDLYVLEYLHTEGDNRQEWVPRVKKVSPDGKVVTFTL